MELKYTWSLLKALSPSLSTNVPTWAAYDSLLASKPVIATVTILPIINETPTGWEHLYTVLKEAERIKNRIFKDGKTIFSFNL